MQGMAPQEYREKKEKVAKEIVGRLEAKLFPGLSQGIDFMEVTDGHPPLLFPSKASRHAHDASVTACMLCRCNGSWV